MLPQFVIIFRLYAGSHGCVVTTRVLMLFWCYFGMHNDLYAQYAATMLSQFVIILQFLDQGLCFVATARDFNVIRMHVRAYRYTVDTQGRVEVGLDMRQYVVTIRAAG